MLLNVEPKWHVGNSAKTVKVNIPNNNHYHELSQFEGSFPVVNLNNVACNQEQHSNWQVAGKKTMKWIKIRKYLLIYYKYISPNEISYVSLISENGRNQMWLWIQTVGHQNLVIISNI